MPIDQLLAEISHLRKQKGRIEEITKTRPKTKSEEESLESFESEVAKRTQDIVGYFVVTDETGLQDHAGKLQRATEKATQLIGSKTSESAQ